jgi:hypothetical protein
MREATIWLDDKLAEAGMTRRGEVTAPHVRPWGTVMRAETDQGPVWLKAPGLATVFEVRLYEIMARIDAPGVLQPIALDAGKGWVLLPDGGTTLGDSKKDLAEAMEEVLPHYAQLQRALAPHTEELLDAGIADMRPSVMLQRFDEATIHAPQRIRAMRDTFAGWCERLQQARVPASLDHNDLHPWNILPGNKFYDWGDSVVAHPFASMLLGLGFLHGQQGDSAIARPRDAYLEVFSDLAPHAELVRELELACQVGKVARALTWERALGLEHDERFADAPMKCLEELLNGHWLGCV